jgi:hypothetical protein
MTTGLLLGDGNLQKPKSCKYYRFRFAQNSIRRDYVNHVFKKYKNGLADFAVSKQKQLVTQCTPRLYTYKTTKNKYERYSYNFETRLSSAFNYHSEIFYSNGLSRKNLCKDLSCFDNLLTPTVLAYWYMDDGTWPNKKAKSFTLCTHGYHLNQVHYFSKLLNSKFDLITKVAFNKNQPIIRISSKSYLVFRNLIYQKVCCILSMQNKFPFDVC